MTRPRNIGRGALLSPDGLYRYRLTRTWGTGPPLLHKTICWVMLNPSTGDAHQDDPTIRRCITYSDRWGYRRLTIVNLFAYRTSDPKELWAAHRDGIDIVGPANRRHVLEAMTGAQRVVAAWGAQMSGAPAGLRRERIDALTPAMRALWCLGETKAGQPLHPCRLAKDLDLRPWYSDPRRPEPVASTP